MVAKLAASLDLLSGGRFILGYTQHGRHYSVRGLEMQRKPAHPIPVWLRAFGPRALSLIQFEADYAG